jgi:lysozyme
MTADFIKQFEGLKLKAYRDPGRGKHTIGWGATFYENGYAVQEGDVINEARAEQLLQYHIRLFQGYVDAQLQRLSDAKNTALVSFCYNVGNENFKNSTLLKKVKANQEDTSIRAEFLKWNQGGGKVLPGLTKRREKEANLYFSESGTAGEIIILILFIIIILVLAYYII